jgi:L-aspartate oxidase
MMQPSRAAVPAPDRQETRAWTLESSWRESPALADSDAVRDLMWRSVGLFRTSDGLRDAVMRLEATYRAERQAMDPSSTGDADRWRRFNLLTVAWLIARAALRRQESRGAHFRADFPARDDLHWKVHLVDKM